jgi:predicted phosphoribosyltransferase
MTRFTDRRAAGRALAARLLDLADAPDVLVLALPRGGVPVAYEIAARLRLPLDVMVVRKLGVPGMPEVAMGAIAGGDVRILDQALIRHLRIGSAAVQEVVAREARELARREREYRGARPVLPVSGRTVVLVDDGLATGSTMLAALEAVRQQGAALVIVAVPVASGDAVASLRSAGCTVVAASTPWPFRSVGEWYEDFAPTEDDEVKALLHDAWEGHAQGRAGASVGTGWGQGGTP